MPTVVIIQYIEVSQKKKKTHAKVKVIHAAFNEIFRTHAYDQVSTDRFLVVRRFYAVQ